MVIQIDTREKAKAIKLILKEFDQQGIKHISSKLYVGDYMSLDNPHTIVDRKQNLSEICANVGGSQAEHERFRNEILRAKDADIQLIVLIEHGQGIKRLEDVQMWENPRKKKYPNATSGVKLFKIMRTMQERYGIRFEFCDKEETGKKILELLK